MVAIFKIFTLIGSFILKEVTQKYNLAEQSIIVQSIDSNFKVNLGVDKDFKDLQLKIKDGSINTEGIKLLSHLTQIKTQIAKSLGRNVG